MKSNLIELRISSRLLRFPEKIGRHWENFKTGYIYGEDSPRRSNVGTLQGNIKTQPGMANVLTAQAKGRSHKIFTGLFGKFSQMTDGKKFGFILHFRPLGTFLVSPKS